MNYPGLPAEFERIESNLASLADELGFLSQHVAQTGTGPRCRKAEEEVRRASTIAEEARRIFAGVTPDVVASLSEINYPKGDS